MSPIRAVRCGVKGTVTFKDEGPQYGAFHPGGDESVIVPLLKRDWETQFEVPCDGCGRPCWVTVGSQEVLGNYHSGCFGYPACGCRLYHKGDCVPGGSVQPVEPDIFIHVPTEYLHG